MKQADREKLQNVLWTTVLWVCVIFFAFAAGVRAGEWEKEAEQEPLEYTLVISEPVTMASMPIPATETAQAGELPLCEDTFIRDDIPLNHELQALLYGACKEFEIDFELALAMIEQETNFKNIMGDGGNAYGYFQVWIKWHKNRMVELGVTDLMDPESNFRVAMHYMRENLDKYGNLEDALSVYNTGGPGKTAYSRSVMEKYYG